MGKLHNLEVKINNVPILSEDSKAFADYLAESIVKKHQKAMTKREIFMTGLDSLVLLAKLCLIIVALKHFPEFISSLYGLLYGNIGGV
jgi:hypothetical protein